MGLNLAFKGVKPMQAAAKARWMTAYSLVRTSDGSSTGLAVHFYLIL